MRLALRESCGNLNSSYPDTNTCNTRKSGRSGFSYYRAQMYRPRSHARLIGLVYIVLCNTIRNTNTWTVCRIAPLQTSQFPFSLSLRALRTLTFDQRRVFFVLRPRYLKDLFYFNLFNRWLRICGLVLPICWIVCKCQ